MNQFLEGIFQVTLILEVTIIRATLFHVAEEEYLARMDKLLLTGFSLHVDLLLISLYIQVVSCMLLQV